MFIEEKYTLAFQKLKITFLSKQPAGEVSGYVPNTVHVTP
jgi:hypothetical protein